MNFNALPGSLNISYAKVTQGGETSLTAVFTSGSATPATATTPEPPSLILTLTGGLLLLGGFLFYERRRSCALPVA